MSIGAHSLSHPILAQTPEDVAWREISESRGVLEKVLGRTVWAFGYPFGNAATVTRRDLRLAEQAGFRCAFMNAGGGFGAKIDRFAVPRVHVTADMNLSEFEAHIAGFYRTLRKKLLGGDELEAAVGLETGITRSIVSFRSTCTFAATFSSGTPPLSLRPRLQGSS